MKMGKWTEEDNNFLKEHYARWRNSELAKHLDRSINAIQRQANNLNLKKFRKAKVIILDDNPFSILHYLEEYDDKFK